MTSACIRYAVLLVAFATACHLAAEEGGWADLIDKHVTWKTEKSGTMPTAGHEAQLRQYLREEAKTDLLGKVPPKFFETHPCTIFVVSQDDAELHRLMAREFVLSLAIDARVHRWLQINPRPKPVAIKTALDSLAGALAGPALRRLRQWPATKDAYTSEEKIAKIISDMFGEVLDIQLKDAYAMGFTSRLTIMPDKSSLDQIPTAVLAELDRYQQTMAGGENSGPAVGPAAYGPVAVPDPVDPNAADDPDAVAKPSEFQDARTLAKAAADGFLGDVANIAYERFLQAAIHPDLAKVPGDDPAFMKAYGETMAALKVKSKAYETAAKAKPATGEKTAQKPGNREDGAAGSPVLEQKPVRDIPIAAEHPAPETP
jgi:hypothetical protein